MLQQTSVATVIPRFTHFVERWPTVSALAAADDVDILGEWAGLGYYARARNLIAAARAVAARGSFPGTAAELRALPGVGAYTAAAVAAIAFGEAAPAVDTNVERVIARLYALERPGRREVERLVAAMIPADCPGDFVQAMMDLGATICRPRNPRCRECPLRPDCAGFAIGRPAEFPQRRAKAVRPERTGVAWWIERDRAIWLVRRPQRGLLGGMAALPGTEWEANGDAVINALASVRHIFTHFALTLDIIPADEPVGEGWWHPLNCIDEAGLPTLYRRAIAGVLGARDAAPAALEVACMAP